MPIQSSLSFISVAFFPRHVQNPNSCGPLRTTSIRTRCCATSPDTNSRALSTASSSLFEMQNVYFRVPLDFERVIFDDMSFHINKEELVVMLGPNGSGKSTAIKIMVGLERADKGTFLWEGEKIKPSNILKRCGVVLQDPAKYFLTSRVIDELKFGRPFVTPDDVRRVLSYVGLSDISLLSNPRSLSGGQIRRLAVADQMLKSPPPRFFILDEPLSGVDWAARRDIMRFLDMLKRKRQLAILLVSHEPADLLPFADRVVEIKDKRVTLVHHDIVEKAIETRGRIKDERRRKAFEDARLYRLEMDAKKNLKT